MPTHFAAGLAVVVDAVGRSNRRRAGFDRRLPSQSALWQKTLEFGQAKGDEQIAG